MFHIVVAWLCLFGLKGATSSPTESYLVEGDVFVRDGFDCGDIVAGQKRFSCGPICNLPQLYSNLSEYSPPVDCVAGPCSAQDVIGQPGKGWECVVAEQAPDDVFPGTPTCSGPMETMGGLEGGCPQVCPSGWTAIAGPNAAWSGGTQASYKLHYCVRASRSASLFLDCANACNLEYTDWAEVFGPPPGHPAWISSTLTALVENSADPFWIGVTKANGTGGLLFPHGRGRAGLGMCTSSAGCEVAPSCADRDCEEPVLPWASGQPDGPDSEACFVVQSGELKDRACHNSYRCLCGMPSVRAHEPVVAPPSPTCDAGWMPVPSQIRPLCLKMYTEVEYDMCVSSCNAVNASVLSAPPGHSAWRVVKQLLGDEVSWTGIQQTFGYSGSFMVPMGGVSPDLSTPHTPTTIECTGSCPQLGLQPAPMAPLCVIHDPMLSGLSSGSCDMPHRCVCQKVPSA
eukprot:TRINITY_DN33333_c0_g1_i1.p1 TRINITY_DN33333_c0_g1~~TRINITY_DN33333_c0_g1_i1.p1  ORF type:complete len:456 (+),score=35.36 TRINITY_DN33333_c0_g1_i1:235-1602(+)